MNSVVCTCMTLNDLTWTAFLREGGRIKCIQSFVTP